MSAENRKAEMEVWNKESGMRIENKEAEMRTECKAYEMEAVKAEREKTKREDRMILGQDAVYSTDSRMTGLNNNVIVCGTSGCGKTMSIAEPRLVETFNTSLIVTVTKKRLARKYKEVFRQRGFEVEDMDFVHPLEGTVSFDPLKYVASYSDITFLSKSIVEMTNQGKKGDVDQYWYDAGASLLAAEIAYIIMTKENPTFADVLQMHDSLKITGGSETFTTSLDEKFAFLESRRPGCFAVTCWKTFRDIAPRTARCIYGMLNTAIDKIFTSDLREAMKDRNSMDIVRLGKRKTVLFVTTSPVNPSIHCYVNLFYSQAFKELFEYAEGMPDGMLPVPVHMICDDFATGGRILNFPEYISIFREKRISVTLLIQSESQLTGIYGESSATTIINNCDTYVYMGGMDLNTAYSVSRRLNIPLDEVLCFPLGQVVIFRRGEKPFLTERYHITENKDWESITKNEEMRQITEATEENEM